MGGTDKNFGQMSTSLDVWMREYIDADLKRDALNDAIESLWMSVLKANIANYVKGPVTTLQVASGSERTQLTSITDPTVAPVPASIAGGALPQVTYQVAYTLVTDSGSETLLSPVAQIVRPINQLLSVPPPANPGTAFGWNVYVGSSAALLARQNAAPLDFLPGTTFTEDAVAGCPDYPAAPAPPIENTTADDIFYIKLLEINLSAGGLQQWNQSSLDSMLMKWAGRSISSTSEYQPYYYDLINGRQLEYRPKTGMAFNPRYFFIHKPRRIKFDSATIPFTTFPWEACIRYKSMAAIKRSFEEWQSADRWETSGDKEEVKIMQLLGLQNWDKDTTIAPYLSGWQ